MDKPKLRIFCDFDGTITLYDAWVEMCETFINDKSIWAENVKLYESGEMGNHEIFIKDCSLIQNFDINTYNRIIDNQRIDAGFKKFYDFCLEQNIPLVILSEGMDYAIGRILKNNGLDIPFYSNRLVFNKDKSSINVEFPYADSDCIKCGISKRNLLMNMTADDEISVYIGDGLSDIYVVNYADIVFAKKTLASYCWKNNITYFDYQTFGDITKKLEKLLSQKTIKHRQAAKLKRRDVFMRG